MIEDDIMHIQYAQYEQSNTQYVGSRCEPAEAARVQRNAPSQSAPFPSCSPIWSCLNAVVDL
jgi:hypothetical protein